MFYRKNVGAKERAVRAVAGVVMVVGSLMLIGTTPLGLVAAGSGVCFALTGLVGFCPACALVGRKPVGEPR
jgi:hypothetical protein